MEYLAYYPPNAERCCAGQMTPSKT